MGTAADISQSPSSRITVTYNNSNGGTLTETAVTSNGSTYSLVTTGIDLASDLGGPAGGSAQAYIGFTSGTGGVTDLEGVSNFAFSNTSSTSLPTSATVITNPVMVAAAASSSIQLAPTANYSSGSVGPITIGTGGNLNVSLGTPAAGVLRGVLTTPSITFTSPTSGQLDISVNALDITSQSLAMITSMVKTGYSNGTWTGPGIVSSAAATDSTHLTAVGVILNSVDGTITGAALYGSGTALGLFDGVNPASTDVLVKYTYYGDTNLDGKVDGTDYSRIDASYASEHNGIPTTSVSGWYNGDFNYDGVVDGSDYTLIDNAFNSQGASLAASIASPTALVGGGSAVPEPATLGVLAMGAAGLLGRRRRGN